MRKGKLEKAFTYLEFGAVPLVTSKDNVMTISWKMVLDFTSRIAICTGSWNDSFDAIIRTKQCTLCVPKVDMLDKVVISVRYRLPTATNSNTFVLKRKNPHKVKALLLADCLAALECKVVDYVEKHGILVLDCVQLWETRAKKNAAFSTSTGTAFFADGEF